MDTHSLPESPPGSPSHATLWLLLPFVAAILLYWPSTQGAFVFDDVPLVVKNEGLWQGQGFDFGIWNTPTPEAVNDGPRINFRPVRFLSYQLDAWLTQATWGEESRDPFYFHLQNIVLHAFNALGVALLIRRLWPKLPIWGAPLIATAFALHPVHSESVAYVSGRRDVLFLFFYLLTIHFYIARREKGSWGSGCVAGGLFVLALASKEMAISLPFALVAVELLLPHPQTRRWRPSFWLPLLTAGGTFLYVWHSYQNPGQGAEHWGGTVSLALASSLRASFHYLGLLIWPQTLTIDYSYAAFLPSQSWLQPSTTVLSALALIALATWACVKWKSGQRGFLVGLVLFYVCLGPVSQLVPHPERMAERFLYLPSLAAMVLIAYAIPERWREPQLWGSVLLIAVLLFGARLHYRLEDWKQPYTLWRSAVEAYPECARAQFALGRSAFELGYHEEALNTLGIALKLLDEHPERQTAGGRLQQGYYLHALSLRSKALSASPMRERQEEALRGYRQLLASTDTTGTGVGEYSEFVVQAMGLEWRLGNADEAKRLAERALQLDTAPTHRVQAYGVLLHAAADAKDDSRVQELLAEWNERCNDDRERGRLLYHRGELLKRQRRWPAAKEAFQNAADIFRGSKNYASARYEVAECLLGEGSVSAARAIFKEVGEGPPPHLASLLRSAELAGTMGDYDEADRHYQRVLQIIPDNAQVRQARAQLQAKKKLLSTPNTSISRVKPSKGFALLQLAEKKIASNEVDKALRALEDADPHLEGEAQLKHRLKVRLLAARLASQLNKPTAALRWYLQYFAVAVGEQRSDALLEYASLLEDQEQGKEAYRFLTSEYEAGVRHPLLTQALFDLALRQQQRADALAWINVRLQESELSSAERHRLQTIRAVLQPVGQDPSSDSIDDDVQSDVDSHNKNSDTPTGGHP